MPTGVHLRARELRPEFDSGLDLTCGSGTAVDLRNYDSPITRSRTRCVQLMRVFDANLSSCIGPNPLRAVVELSSVSIVKTTGHSNWHELCHVGGDRVGYPEAAHASLYRGEWSSSPVMAWSDSTFDGFQLPSRYSQSLNRDNDSFPSLLS